MARQISIFDGAATFEVTSPIRLIELFAGYGSQALALRYLGVPFEHWKISEWAIPSIQAYKDVHFPTDNTDYSEGKTVAELRKILFDRNVSNDYNKPMTAEQIERLGEKKVRTVYNNMQATNNLGSITQIHGADLEITDTDSHTYIMTYSFPCQDLSTAGLGAGMAEESGTRSGLLWQVRRLLHELHIGGGRLPQILLMENVPQVIGTANMREFAKWLAFLENIGYKCYWKLLNAKNYGLPQNRNRCFMISLYGDYDFDFPEEVRLERVLKDMLEPNVPEKYYLTDAAVEQFIQSTIANKDRGNGFEFAPTNGGGDCELRHHQGREQSDRQLHH